jgi:hypothetical protein
MRYILIAAVLCLAPCAARAQATDHDTSAAPAPVPAVPAPSAQTGGGNVPPEQIAPPAKGSIGRAPAGTADRPHTGGGVAH